MIRGIGLRSGVSLNVITMIGIGPLITIPLVLQNLAGPLALAGWIGGAIVALCDGLVWAELASRYPGTGGTYVYLREIFGADRWGRLFAFLFNWQFSLAIPLTLATGYIGFANYVGYLFPALATSTVAHNAVAAGIGIFTIVLLYRRITQVAALGVFLAVAAIGTLLIIILAGLPHADLHRAFTLGSPVTFGLGFLSGFGSALYITLYDYAGYSQVALVGEEVHDPKRVLPLAVVGSIIIVATLYVLLQISVLGVVPWQTLVGHAGGNPPAQAQYVGSTVVRMTWGPAASAAVTVLILITAFASVYGGLLGASRIPFAAARDGAFLPIFARLHPREHFPYVSLLTLGAISVIASFFDLGFVIAVLSATGILLSGFAQIAALFLFRIRHEKAPFRMWLFPLPALVALAGWSLAFIYTGRAAIALGVLWLLAGTLAYLVTARSQRKWPFATALLAVAALSFAGILLTQRPANSAPTAWPGSQIVIRKSYPVFTVDGKPFFVYGAAFFYERIPRSQWQSALQQYRALGINTIDLYAIWNWHELRDGDFDFSGRTNARRDLLGLMRLIDRDGFKVVLRPGPVIRNEWRNGGYPAWLLRRPEYHMPLRDVLEGRYPATATLQNRHSDDAAAEWLANKTHIRYASRWLRTVLGALSPWRRDVISIALDDDQGAYIDNQTWPAPHFQRYIKFLGSIVRGVTGPAVPLFINTYQMKVTAAAPVWAWGNWYQSDTYSIGEHDRSQLEFSTGLIATQPARPVMVSEFQAGWLQGADEARPRPADPVNTMLALSTMLQSGAHGVINFPVQDTFYPSGWEVPWANAFYSWDAALSIAQSRQARWKPTHDFGEIVARYGTLLAQTHVKADAAIAYLTSSYDPQKLRDGAVPQIADATQKAQLGCRLQRITCVLVDLRFTPVAQLKRYNFIIVPATGVRTPFIPAVALKLRTLRSEGVIVTSNARQPRIAYPAAGGIPNAALLLDPGETWGFLSIVNYSFAAQKVGPAVLNDNPRFSIGATVVPPRDAVLIPLNSSTPAQHINSSLPAPLSGTKTPLRPDSFIAGTAASPYLDGYPVAIFENARMRLIVSPCAGARSFVFEDTSTGRNLFTTTGALRDAWTPELQPSPRDYIAAYTHPIAAGTFNRCYSRHGATFTYYAPDAPPAGAAFRRRIIVHAANAFEVVSSVRFSGYAERLQQISSLAFEQGDAAAQLPNGLAIYDPPSRTVTLVAWRATADVKSAFKIHAGSVLLTLTYESGGPHATFYGFAHVASLDAAKAALAQFAKAR